mgnify:CR=1 FL=1
MKGLRWWFLVIDIGFIVYWIITALHLIPAEYLYNDYENPILVDWNWSFLPLDLLISFTGLTSIRLYRQNSASWERWALVSLVFTFVSGLQALAFWTIRGDFDPTWWFFNGILLVYPLFYLPRLFKAG